MKFTWLAAAGLLAFAAPAVAGEAPPAPQPAASVSAQLGADPERVALAREMMDVLDAKAMLKNMYGNVLSGIKKPAGLTPDQQARFDQLMSSLGVGLEATIPEMTDLMVDVYAQNLTAQDMRDTLTFYRSPAGQAVLKKVPSLTQQAVARSQQLMPKVWATAQADYCKRRTCDKQDAMILEVVGRIYGIAPAH